MANVTMVKSFEQDTVITHGGVFHADEVFATVILAKVFGELKVIRAFKVPENVNDDIVVYDIGGGKYDHHQRGGNGSRENGVPYAACGLVWRAYGKQLCENKDVWQYLDNTLIQGIDAVDNGKMPKTEYVTQAMTISQTISLFNPTWDSDENPDEAFKKAVDFAETVFDNTMKRAISTVKAKVIVDKAIAEAEGGILVLDKFVPWQEHLFASKDAKAEEALFVVYPSNRGGFNWQCIPDALGSFGQRKSVPEEWRGLDAEKLQEVTKVADATFCHPAGFIGAANSLEGAIQLAKIAIES